ncbi:hypothetical protein [Methylomonas albis]|uniref:Uncharacterized protein n=1 Tax=Methylomonas albis TaxID=1854563 RepID=A0ABR9D3H1_9GAMM|nr:hypothetical protein [Methylomonas albis]MBD9356813.1 hypothetical protein [Methylomonas albis]
MGWQDKVRDLAREAKQEQLIEQSKIDLARVEAEHREEERKQKEENFIIEFQPEGIPPDTFEEFRDKNIDRLVELDSTIGRKKLTPMQRATSESLLLIYNLTEKYRVKYLDQLEAPAAWGKIVSGEFKSDLIREIIGDKKIKYNDGELQSGSEFREKYLSRFK